MTTSTSWHITDCIIWVQAFASATQTHTAGKRVCTHWTWKTAFSLTMCTFELLLATATYIRPPWERKGRRSIDVSADVLADGKPVPSHASFLPWWSEQWQRCMLALRMVKTILVCIHLIIHKWPHKTLGPIKQVSSTQNKAVTSHNVLKVIIFACKTREQRAVQTYNL